MGFRHILQFLVAAAMYAVADYSTEFLRKSYCGYGIADGPEPGPGCGYVLFLPLFAAILGGFIAGWGLRARMLWLAALMPLAGALLASLAMRHSMGMSLIFDLITGVLPALGAAAAAAALSGARACPKCDGRKLNMTEEEAKGEGITWTAGGKVLFWMLAAGSALTGLVSPVVAGVLLALMAAIYFVSSAVHTAAYQCSGCYEITTYRAASAAAKRD